MTTYLLGANGRIGRTLHHHAERIGLGWQTQTRASGGDVQWSGDFHDPSCADLFRHGTTLINMIGQTGTNQEKLEATNVQFVKSLIKRASDTGVAHIILASSAAVYGDHGGAPLTEDAELKPLNEYGESKARMEDAVHEAAASQIIPAISILRIGNVAGSDSLLTAARKHMALGKKVPIHRFSSGAAPLRSYIGPHDLFTVVNALSQPHDRSVRTLNVVASNPVYLDDALAAYKTYLLPELEWTDTPAPKGTPEEITLSTKNLDHLVTLPEIEDYAFEMARQVAQDQPL